MKINTCKYSSFYYCIEHWRILQALIHVFYLKILQYVPSNYKKGCSGVQQTCGSRLAHLDGPSAKSEDTRAANSTAEEVLTKKDACTQCCVGARFVLTRSTLTQKLNTDTAP